MRFVFATFPLQSIGVRIFTLYQSDHLSVKIKNSRVALDDVRGGFEHEQKDTRYARVSAVIEASSDDPAIARCLDRDSPQSVAHKEDIF